MDDEKIDDQLFQLLSHHDWNVAGGDWRPDERRLLFQALSEADLLKRDLIHRIFVNCSQRIEQQRQAEGFDPAIQEVLRTLVSVEDWKSIVRWQPEEQRQLKEAFTAEGLDKEEFAQGRRIHEVFLEHQRRVAQNREPPSRPLREWALVRSLRSALSHIKRG